MHEFVPPEPVEFPVETGCPARAVQVLFAGHVIMTRTRASSGVTEWQAKEILDEIERMVDGRFMDVVNNLALSHYEEIEFVFKESSAKSGLYNLEGPTPLLKYLEYKCQDTFTFQLRTSKIRNVAKRGSEIVLRVTPDLVTIGGVIVWQRRTGA